MLVEKNAMMSPGKLIVDRFKQFLCNFRISNLSMFTMIMATNFLFHVLFRSRKKISTTYAIVTFFSPGLSMKISQKLSMQFP